MTLALTFSASHFLIHDSTSYVYTMPGNEFVIQQPVALDTVKGG